MVTFEAEIERFEKNGEKTGWTYVFIPAAIADQIRKNCKKSFRIKGKLDEVEVNGMAFIPMGEGDFILPLKASLRKILKKQEGDILRLALQEDKDFKIELPEDLELCLMEDNQYLENFLKMPKSHQNYYINWLNTAKTEETRTKRLVSIVNAMEQGLNFSEMMRSSKS